MGLETVKDLDFKIMVLGLNEIKCILVCLSLFRLLQQNITGAYKLQKCISHSFGGWKTKDKVLSEALLPGDRLLLVSSHDRRGCEAWGVSLKKSTNLIFEGSILMM